MTARMPFEDEPEITPSQLKQLLDAGEPLVLIDVREPYEWQVSNLAPQGARLIPLADIPERVGELKPEDDIVLYCRSGQRSASAATFMRAHGFVRVRNLRGGMAAWAEEMDPNLPVA